MSTSKLSYTYVLINPANQFVVTLATVSSPGVILETVPVAGPYTPPWQMAFTTALAEDGTMYIATLWESPNSTATGLVRDSHSFDATQSGTTFRDNLDLIADTSPGLTSGLNKYTDPSNSLAGWTYTLFRVGGGPLMLTTDYTLDSNNNWTLVDGTTIQPLERYVLIFQGKLGAAVPPPPSLISSGLVITGNVTMDATYINKQLILQGAGLSMTETLPPLSAVTDFQRVIISSCAGTHVNAVINTSGTDKIQRYDGNTNLRTQLILGQNENLELYRMTVSGTPYWFVSGDLKGVDAVGKVVEHYGATMTNGLVLNGQQVLKTTYARLWAWVQLQSGILVSQATWSHTNSSGFSDQKGNYWTPTDTTKFGLPDLTVFGFRRSKNAPGVFEQEDLMTHAHAQKGGNAPGTGTADPLIALGFPAVSGGTRNMNNTDNYTGAETRPNSTGINLFVLI